MRDCSQLSAVEPKPNMRGQQGVETSAGAPWALASTVSVLINSRAIVCALGLQVLEKVCWYAVLAPSGTEQVTLLNTTAGEKRLEELPHHRALLQSFLTKEARRAADKAPLGPGPCRS